VGRLDRNTTGVLLLTNDGALAEKLMHPRYARKKVYQVTLDRELTRSDMEKLVEGVDLEEGTVAADAVSYVSQDDRKVIGLEIHSGQNRVVRRLFEKMGYKVKNLDRVSFAGLTKKALPRGRWRYLTEKEIIMLYRRLY
jgi:23S rRNA pseudouridine2605 synthase